MGALNSTVFVKAEDGVNMVPFGPESEEIPDWALEQIGAHAFEDGEKPDSAGSAPYSKWKKAALEAEVESRNEGRAEADLIEVGGKGTVADLVDALEADDADSAAGQE